ncbi:hypothetical protein VTN49DRAFT_2510 [Thermomyces lanuginosus]|uniref:uncharacterized protein n=1 Tax=Thermomyces lanuginosus TaxID=5541 RepID=UPI00374201A3
MKQSPTRCAISDGDMAAMLNRLKRSFFLGRSLGQSQSEWWFIHAKQKLTQQIPWFIVLYAIVGDKIVIAPVSQTTTEALPVHIWDLNSNCVQRIGGLSSLRLCHVSAADNVPVAFEINSDAPARPENPNLQLRRDPSRTYGHKTLT